VGAGNLGSALLRHAQFVDGSYTFVAAFDRKPKRIGATIGGIEVSPMEAMNDIVKKMGAEIGVIAVKPDWAQEAADLLVTVLRPSNSSVRPTSLPKTQILVSGWRPSITGSPQQSRDESAT
jgi:FlaA1/EpsC-like NDP-sugar epimerase